MSEDDFQMVKAIHLKLNGIKEFTDEEKLLIRSALTDYTINKMEEKDRSVS